MSDWYTKLKGLSEKQLSYFDDCDAVIDKGMYKDAYYVVLPGLPVENIRLVNRVVGAAKADEKNKKDMTKALTEAKDADTVRVFTWKDTTTKETV